MHVANGMASIVWMKLLVLIIYISGQPSWIPGYLSRRRGFSAAMKRAWLGLLAMHMHGIEKSTQLCSPCVRGSVKLHSYS